ncbi:MAG: hypothetical protein JJU33_05270 [Phycisphaerales bacterium]|nr:hypothetical protein [Phycisphaerales bacterium]
MPKKTGTSRAETEAGDGAAERRDESFVCPRCRFAVGTPDAPNCPECGVALRLGYVGHWVVDSKRWMRRITILLLAIALLLFGTTVLVVVYEIAHRRPFRAQATDVGWLTQLVIAAEAVWHRAPWPQLVTYLATAPLACYALWVAKRNLLPHGENTDPEKNHATAAWKRISRLLKLTVALLILRLAMQWEYIRNYW